LFQFAGKIVNGLGSLLERQLERGGVSLFVRELVAQLDQLGAEPVIIAFDWGEPPRFPTHVPPA
jgi:hypothetical protein